jgi:hypothetical protein
MWITVTVDVFYNKYFAFKSSYFILGIFEKAFEGNSSSIADLFAFALRIFFPRILCSRKFSLELAFESSFSILQF